MNKIKELLDSLDGYDYMLAIIGAIMGGLLGALPVIIYLWKQSH